MPLNIKEIKIDGYHKVIISEDSLNKFYSIIAIHNINRGPSLGGCRYFKYDNKKDQLNDVLNLSKAMSYKNAMAEIPFGGGKATVHADCPKNIMHSLFSETVNSLKGDYITAGDIGLDDSDLRKFNEFTKYVCSTKGSDSGLSTAIGVNYAMKGYFGSINDKENLNGKNILIKGYGKVGSRLAKICSDQGANIEIIETNEIAYNNAKKNNFSCIKSIDETSFENIDIFSPCATGGDVNAENYSFFCQKVKLILGAANNQLANEEIEQSLLNSNVDYCPDYCANAGGVIILALRVSVRDDLEPYEKEANDILEKIKERTRYLFETSKNRALQPSIIAKEIAEENLFK